ncbi:hypothetical protein EHO58_19425 [Leptospira selangorensis]|nr:hypothetical protein EHO58_19425 [Leptospira selangorensis]
MIESEQTINQINCVNYFTASNCRLIAALRDCFATLAWPSAHFALSLILLGKLRAKCLALAKRR